MRLLRSLHCRISQIHCKVWNTSTPTKEATRYFKFQKTSSKNKLTQGTSKAKRFYVIKQFVVRNHFVSFLIKIWYSFKIGRFYSKTKGTFLHRKFSGTNGRSRPSEVHPVETQNVECCSIGTKFPMLFCWLRAPCSNFFFLIYQ